MQLDTRNQANFDQLERIYLYDIPEYDDNYEELITCSYCGCEFHEDEIKKLNMEYCCNECALQLYKDGEITREEFEEIYG